MQLKRRHLDILWGPIAQCERKKSSCLNEASFTLLVNKSHNGSQNIAKRTL